MPPSIANPTVRTYAVHWQDNVLPLKTPATIATFSSHLRWFLRTPLADKPLAELSTSDVQSVLTAARSTVQPVTLRNRWLTLRTMLATAKRERLLGEIPEPELPKKRRAKQPALSAERMAEIIRSASGQYRAFYALLSETGVRIGEALGLGPLNIDLDRRVLTVDRAIYNGRAGGCKTHSSYRSVCISEPLAALLEPLVRKTDVKQTIFQTSKGTPLWPAEIQRVTGNPAPFHAFRRGNVTLCHATIGIPEAILARRVGHTLPGMTLGVYFDARAEDDRPWVESIARAIGLV